MSEFFSRTEIGGIVLYGSYDGSEEEARREAEAELERLRPILTIEATA